MFDQERGLYIAHCANGALSITGKMANRHGLIAGAIRAKLTDDGERPTAKPIIDK